MTSTTKTTFFALVRDLFEYRQLLTQMIRREIIGRYRGSVLGLAWSFFNPLLMLLVYTFVFSVVFKARWGLPEDQGKVSYATILFTGMIVHGLFAECINRAPGLVLANPSYVKKVVFPLQILPWVSMGAAFFHAMVSVLILVIAILFLNGSLSITVIFLPLVLFPLIVATMGVSWFLASTGVYLRDIGQTVGLLTTILLFLSPVFFPVSALPPRFQAIMMLNPLTFIIEQSRNVLLWGKGPDWIGLFVYTLLSAGVAWAGYYWFQKTRKGFADVL